jgi:TPP-dependent pyruvate/acetoin dehydrogenase alpha subunit
MTLPNQEQSRDLLKKALRVRLIEQRIVDIYDEYEIRCPTHFSLGQEAIAVGVCAHLSKSDLITSAHRNHAHYLSKGGNLKAMISELYGKETGCASGKGGSMHLIDREAGFLGAVPIVGSTIPIGIGATFAAYLQGSTKLTVIFFGDAATETGVFYESLNFAALHKLPVVMVCENNFYSVMTSLRERRPEGFEIYNIAKPFGVFSEQGDGNDLDAVFQLSGKAIEHARSGKGPAFIEFKTYRYIEHCGPFPDDKLNYRSKNELEEWKKRDPIHAYKERLLTKQYITENEFLEWTTIIHKEIDEAIGYAKASAFPHKTALFKDLFAA